MKRIFLLLALLASVSISHAQTQTPFKDVPNNHWAAAAIAKLEEWGIIRGYSAAKPVEAARQISVKHHVAAPKRGKSTPVK
jgi:hypothetical protein